MSLARQDQSSVVTEHALLVAYGQFARQVGLIQAIEQVPFRMKTVEHSPADKVLELLGHILAGGMHINALAKSAHPLVKDQAVAQAWGQEAFASASGVSQLLHTVSADSVKAVKQVIDQVIEPYRRRVLRELSPAWLVVDLDLTGLVVSDQAATYEGADFGYMGELGKVGRGYQFARAQLVARQEPFVLGGFLHSGRTLSASCLAELVSLVEAQLGRPRRRVECLEARLSEVQRRLTASEAELTKLADKADARPAYQERVRRRVERQRAEVEALSKRRDQLALDNASNPNPRRIIFRLDGGFGIASDVTWLYEQGYSVVGRVHSSGTAPALRKEEGLIWDKVSKNGFIAEAKRTKFGECPYPMRLFACRQWWGDKHPERWSALVVTPDLDAKDWPTRRVGVFYNARQVIEAGIKEAKGIFASRHLPSRHEAGIALYQELVLLAQNLIRWFGRQCLGHTVLARVGVKELVRIGANSRAQVISGQGTTLLAFAADSPWHGLTLPLKTQFSLQLWFPFLEDPALARAGP